MDVDFVAEFFTRGVHADVYVTVCSQGEGGICDPEIESVDIGRVTVSVQPNTVRIFPYGVSANDRSFRDVLDGARPIYPPDGVPFFSDYYTSLHVRELVKLECVETCL